MQTGQDHAVKVLNGLIETTLDSANGYREAAENIDTPELKSMFSQRSQRRQELVRELQEEVRSFGGEPEEEQSAMGKAHNKFVDLKNAVTGGGSEKAVINEVERGEDFIKEKFQKALDDQELPSTAREVVAKAYGSIKADHDEISRIKHQFH